MINAIQARGCIPIKVLKTNLKMSLSLLAPKLLLEFLWPMITLQPTKPLKSFKQALDWSELTSNNLQWLPMTTDDYRWLPMTTNDYQWLSMTIDDLQWLNDIYVAANVQIQLMYTLADMFQLMYTLAENQLMYYRLAS